MKNKEGIKGIFLITVIILSSFMARAQSGDWQYSVEAQAGISPNGKLPFWLRSDQNGNIPLSGLSTGYIGSAFKGYDSTASRSSFKWGAGIQGRVNAGTTGAKALLLQGYVKASKGIFEVKAGRFNQIVGIVDSTLSSGAFSISGNALGIPQILISIPDYYSIPWFGKLFAIKASYAAGYVGDVRIGRNYSDYVNHTQAYYQQNSLYLRLAKPGWRLSLYGGINHNVMFTNEKDIFGPNYSLSLPAIFLYTATGKTYYPKKLSTQQDATQVSKVGNHIGSIDLSLQYEFDNVRLLAYRQNLYDIGAIGHFANINDGINGISLTNKQFERGKIDWHKVLFEIVYTRDQAGYRHSVFTTSGDENYYNNYEYADGWTYNTLNLGNPLLASRAYVRKGTAADPDDYIIDNRVCAFNVGADGSINGISVLGRATVSINNGTYGTSPEGHSHGNRFYTPLYGQFGLLREYSGYLEMSKNLPKDYTAGFAVAGDYGGLYDITFGLLLKLKKTFK